MMADRGVTARAKSGGANLRQWEDRENDTMKTDVVIEVERGMVTRVFADPGDVRVVVVDWDSIERGGSGEVTSSDALSKMAAEARREHQRAVGDV
jgi:hypothetical protein